MGHCVTYEGLSAQDGEATESSCAQSEESASEQHGENGWITQQKGRLRHAGVLAQISFVGEFSGQAGTIRGPSGPTAPVILRRAVEGGRRG
jgi:hypothetical protein